MTRKGSAAAGGGGRATAYAVLAAALALLLLASPARAGDPTGGASADAAPAPERLGPVPFGVVMPKPASVRDVRCLSGCAAAGALHTGARLRLRGRNLRRTDTVVFLGAAGAGDDVATRPLHRTAKRVDVRVPLGAVAGPVTVVDRTGMQAPPAPAPLTFAPAEVNSPLRALVASPQIEVQVAAPRGFYDAAVPPHATYVVHGASATAVTIAVVRDADGAVVASWPGGPVAADVPQTASWSGVAAGHLQKAGHYSFRITAQSAGAPLAASSQATGPDPASFVFLKHVFPVRGPHYFGEGAARFGGARHHQGQDVFAACGTPLVAARGGTVKFRGFQGAAGNYLVIDGARTGTDYAYMHLRERALVKPGQRVRTGELIGHVGDTGDADGCHLHQELWTAPGWYDGGKPVDPLPSLQAWDRTS
jgi:murein DD-endopeptidase MepM/ murein hydrolase activator NlpD